jgi:hypothetical protein
MYGSCASLALVGRLSVRVRADGDVERVEGIEPS